MKGTAGTQVFVFSVIIEHPSNYRFNLIGFSKNVSKWMSKVTLADEQKCHEAIEWISRLSADGNTCTLQAIQVTFINGFAHENDLLLQCKHLPLQAH